MLSSLTKLEQQDPAKFKQVVSDIADKLKTAAAAPDADPRLAKLADKFAQVAQSGDLSALQPQHGHSGAHAHHGHHHYEAAGQQGATATQDLFQSLASELSSALGSSSADSSAATAAPNVQTPASG